MVANAAKLLGIGIYTPPEAAWYARVTTQLMTRWVHGDRKGEAVLRAQLRDDPEKTITFIDFVEALTVRFLRHNYPGLSLSKIRQAAEYASERYHIDRPFAHDHRAVFHGKELWIAIRGREESEELFTQVTGRRGRDQTLIREVAQLYLNDLRFDGPDGLATEYVIYRYKSVEIKMNPLLHLGEPRLPSGHHPATIVDAIRAEGSVEAVAQAFEIDAREVEAAWWFDDHLAGRAAA